VEFLIADAPADAARIYEAMVRQKTRRYLDTRGVDGFDRPGYRGYYRVMTDRFLSSGGVQLSALLLDGAPIATQWAVITPDRFYSLMPAFEVGPSARHSPGLLHLEETIAWCVRERIAILDLGVGDELYKLRIANARLPLFRGEYAATLAGRAYLAALAARHKLSAGPLGEAWRPITRRAFGGRGRNFSVAARVSTAMDRFVVTAQHPAQPAYFAKRAAYPVNALERPRS